MAAAALIADKTRIDLTPYVRRGDRIVIGQACGEPTTLVEALIAQGRDIGGLSVFIATSFSSQFTAEAADSFAISSMGAIGSLRRVSAGHRLAVVPVHVSQLGAFIAEGLIGCDVVLVQVSPADGQGNHSLGLVSDHIQAAVARARVVIAEINDQVPFTFGESLHASRIDVAIRSSREPMEIAPARVGETDEAIARHVARFIDDRAVLQVGVGSVPQAVLHQISDRRDLGVHSGMIGDGIADLMQAGVITNAAKPIDQGVSITCTLVGTRRLYAFAHRNPAIRMCPGSYTHDAAVLARLPGLVAINSAIEVDLSGQVNAEQSNDAYLGGTGGQVDFGRAGQRSPGGRGIIALPATARAGTVSRITANMRGPVTTARNDVDVIVTEYGAAELKGQTLAERARRLVAIAHPDFRAGLDRAAHDISRRGF